MLDIRNPFAPYIGGSGLIMTVGAGAITINNVFTSVPLTVVSLTANATNFIFVNSAAQVQVNTSGFPMTCLPVAQVITNSYGIVTLTDNRPDFFFGSTATITGIGAPATVSFSATPTFNALTASWFKMTLTGNVTSSTLSGAVAGQLIVFQLTQDGVGGRTFTFPTNVKNAQPPDPGANAITFQVFSFDGTNAYPLSGATVN